MYGTHFPTAERQCPIPCQRSHLPPSAFQKLEGESGAQPGGPCQGLSLITIRAGLINIPRGLRPCLASPPASCCGEALCIGGGAGTHSGPSAEAWLQLSEALPCAQLHVPSTDLCISSLSRSTVQNHISQAQSPASPDSQASVGRCLWAIP